MMPRSGGSYEGIEEALDSLASETISSSTVGGGGGGGGALLRRDGSRLRLRCRGWSAALRKDGAFVEVGVELRKRD